MFYVVKKELKRRVVYSRFFLYFVSTEQFSDAVSELTKCLNIQKNLLKPDDRLLAETYLL